MRIPRYVLNIVCIMKVYVWRYVWKYERIYTVFMYIIIYVCFICAIYVSMFISYIILCMFLHTHMCVCVCVCVCVCTLSPVSKLNTDQWGVLVTLYSCHEEALVSNIFANTIKMSKYFPCFPYSLYSNDKSLPPLC